MDYHALQQKLFQLDPTDPAEDLAKLKQAAQGSLQDVPPAKDYVNESAQVTEGSLPLGMDSIADFAALAGVRIDETQKQGSTGQAKGKDPMPKTSKPSTTGEQPHPLKDKLVGEDDTSAVQHAYDQFKSGAKKYNKVGAISTGIDDPKPEKTKQTKNKNTAPTAPQPQETSNLPVDMQQKLVPYLPALNIIFNDPKSIRKFQEFMQRYTPKKESDQKPIKPRDPNWRDMEALRKSGASGVHKDQNKKKELPRKAKHKKAYESLQSQLYNKLKEKGWS